MVNLLLRFCNDNAHTSDCYGYTDFDKISDFIKEKYSKIKDTFDDNIYQVKANCDDFELIHEYNDFDEFSLTESDLSKYEKPDEIENYEGSCVFLGKRNCYFSVNFYSEILYSKIIPYEVFGI